jgi:hypothetical protein
MTKTLEHIGKYAIEYDEAERRYCVAAGALVISTHPTLADAELAAHRYVAGDKRRGGANDQDHRS